MCAGVTIYGALKRCQPELAPGGTVGIVGCGGGLGHLGLMFAAAMGYRVVGVDAADEALQLARALDLGERVAIVDARRDDAVQVRQQQQQQQQDGLDAVIVLPEAQAGFDYGMQLLRNHGKCVVVSFPDEGFRLSARDLVFRGITVVGCLVGSNKLLREMLDYAATHDIRAKVTTYRLAALNELVAQYHGSRSGGKLVVDMSLS